MCFVPNSWPKGRIAASIKGQELFSKALILNEQGDIANAERYFFLAIKTDSLPSYWVELALFYFEIGQYYNVVKVTSTVLDRYPSFVNEIESIHNAAIDVLGEDVPNGVVRIKTQQHLTGSGKRNAQNNSSKIIPLHVPTPRTRLPTDKISVRCKEKWGIDYEMIEYCTAIQIAAKKVVDETYEDEVKEACQRKWGWNYEMIEYCVKNQRQARSHIITHDNDRGTKFCKDKWSTNYEMVEYCMENQ